MKHFGDITKLSGYDLPVVDVITGGSPCQDLSVAGKRAGLAGERSGLFMEQMRIVKEMRERDRANGRTGWMVRPRYMVWENVPGAFSSGTPKGADFAAVIEEIVKAAEPGTSVPVCVPNGGWTKSGCYYAEDGSWSIAWRVHDAQFWGVPQRRKRISLVADFGGLSASEILFERKGLSRDPEPCGEAGQETARAAGGGVEETEPTPINTEEHGHQPVVVDGVLPFDTTQITSPQNGCNPHYGDPCHPLAAGAHPPAVAIRGEQQPVVAFTQNQRNEVRDLGDVAGALAAEPGVHQQTYVYENHSQDSRYKPLGEVSETVSAKYGTGGNNQPLVVSGTYQAVTSALTPGAHPGSYNGQDAYNDMLIAQTISCGNPWDPQSERVFHGDGARHSLAGNSGGGQSRDAVMVFDKEMYNCGKHCTGTPQAREDTVALTCRADAHPSGVAYNAIVRRLTPLECERLQGYPDGWTNIGEWVDSKGKKHKDADSPRYKALGNSIALPFWQWMARRICAQYERTVTMASLFDGIGGFPLVFQRCGAVPVWASEIEEFPIAVTKVRFPDESV